MMNAQKLAAARKRRDTIRHVAWEKERYANEPEWAQKRRDYYNARYRQKAANMVAK